MIIVRGQVTALTQLSGFQPNSIHAFMAVANTRFAWLAKRRITKSLRNSAFTNIKFLEICAVNKYLAKDSGSLPLKPDTKELLDDAKRLGVVVLIAAETSK